MGEVENERMRLRMRVYTLSGCGKSGITLTAMAVVATTATIIAAGSLLLINARKNEYV